MVRIRPALIVDWFDVPGVELDGFSRYKKATPRPYPM